ncbi:MAG: hypothetical protein GY866_34315 [Proteobacteria bacterium]|nr:hypothetical protein [Pseudomonadota bacterium]
MKRMNSSTFFMISLLLLIAVMAVGTLSFFSNMNDNFLLIQKGTTPAHHVIDHYMYVQNKKGFIFSLTFLTVGVSFFVMVVLPSEEGKVVSKVAVAPQPVSPAREESTISAVLERPAPEVEPVERAEPAPAKEEAIIAAADETVTQIETMDTEAFEDVTEGEDDVVYGTGIISDAAIMHFVHKFPDSALKFLYRKQLDGKALTTSDEEIYQGWEQRQMTRGKVKGYIQTLMDWKEFPKKPLYEIWKQLRDHIFENVE